MKRELRLHIDLQRAMTSKRSKTSCDRAKDRSMTFAIRCILNAPLIFVYLLMLAPYVCGRPLDDYTQTVSFLIKLELSKKDNPPVFSFGMEALT